MTTNQQQLPSSRIQSKGKSRYKPGDRVIYSMAKVSTHPGPRAKLVAPSEKGEAYTYFVDKYWVVSEIKDDGKILLKTRRGKERLIEPDDPCLRHASLFEKFIHAYNFPSLDTPKAAEDSIPAKTEK